MASRDQRDVHAIALSGLSIANRFRSLRKPIAVPCAHDGKRFCCRKHRAMTAARVVGMTVGNQRARHRPNRVNVEITRRAIEPVRRWTENGFRLDQCAAYLIRIRIERQKREAGQPMLAHIIAGDMRQRAFDQRADSGVHMRG